MEKLKQIGRETWKHWREISFVFIVQLFAGLVASICLYNEMSKEFGSSMVLDHLAEGFDRTVLMDIVYSSDDLMGSSLFVAGGIVFLYLIIGSFLQTGWLANINLEKYQLKDLLNHGKRYFFPFFGIGILSIILVLGVGLGVAFGFTTIVGDPLVTFSSEKPYVIWIIVLSVLFISWSIMIWCWGIASKCHYISDPSFIRSLKAGFSTLRKQTGKFMAIGYLVFGIHVLFMFSYYWIMGDRGAPSWFIVFTGILVQQIFNYLRIGLRGFGYVLIEDLV